ncbi:DoxX family protein [Metabacillus niabensis]|uniref:Membrane protein YphA (DoxX/SURF4 family) n=1 Tax=Metabacillus niabensis TaxID=324854 RepID=A0ABT9Z535_9BACI|nr:DoxX family protein [Metabacillus niabensis]MDQ0227363.1 putative membrane protein YphA (DoxX/SURF4 family) [Metabacillus niabensis]
MNKTGEIGAVILRLVLGFTFFMHGYDKFQGGIDNTAGFFSSLGLPGFMAYIVGGIEVVGGIAVIIGLGTRIISAIFAVIMLGAILMVKIGNGFLGGYELDIVLMAVAIYLFFKGNTILSIDSKLPKRSFKTVEEKL